MLILSMVDCGLIVYNEKRDPAEWTDPEYIGFTCGLKESSDEMS